MPPLQYNKSYSLLNRFTLVVAFVWLSIILGSMFWGLHLNKRHTRVMAINVARGYLAKDMAFRLWGAKHGGVYAPVTQDSPPNPYLSHVPERDIVTPSGKQLTLINPAYMIRQMMVQFSVQTGVNGHLTSLKLLNPINKPDPWEEKQLYAFDRGVKEVVAFVELNGEPTLRIMQPFITKAACLKCHAQQDYKVGDVRGATSMSIPMKSYMAMAHEMLQSLVFTHLSILLLGLGGIWWGWRRFRTNLGQHIDLENDLIEQNEFTRSIIEALSHPFIVFDADTYKVEFANAAALGGETLNDQACYSLSHHRKDPCVGDEHPCPIQLLREGKKSVTVDHLHYDVNDNLRNVEINCYPILNENGELSKVIEYAIDVTERHFLLKEKEKLQSQLFQSQKIEAIGQLSGGIAHDFNNLLTAILGYSELSIAALEPDHPVQKYIAIIQSTGEKATSLTKQLLAFSRKQTLDMQLIYFDTLLEDMAKMMGRLLGENIEVQLNLDSGGLAIKGDPSQLEQVVLNLAVNARDAMPLGGRLIFTTKIVSFDSGSDHTLEIPPGEYLHLKVSDNGSGMSQEVKEKIYEPFFTTKKLGEGTGLGLSTVFGIIKQHDSFIFVDSALGVGTTFNIYLPVSSAVCEAVEGIDRTGEPIPTGVETIMVVDDEPLIVDLIRVFLTGFGYAVIAMESPHAALAYLDECSTTIDLLLTDVVMPKMNGTELAQEVRLRQPDIRLIYMSGYTDKILARHEVQQENVHILKKPINTKKLGYMIRKVLDE